MKEEIQNFKIQVEAFNKAIDAGFDLLSEPVNKASAAIEKEAKRIQKKQESLFKKNDDSVPAKPFGYKLSPGLESNLKFASKFKREVRKTNEQWRKTAEYWNKKYHLLAWLTHCHMWQSDNAKGERSLTVIRLGKYHLDIIWGHFSFVGYARNGEQMWNDPTIADSPEGLVRIPKKENE